MEESYRKGMEKEIPLSPREYYSSLLLRNIQIITKTTRARTRTNTTIRTRATLTVAFLAVGEATSCAFPCGPTSTHAIEERGLCRPDESVRATAYMYIIGASPVG